MGAGKEKDTVTCLSTNLHRANRGHRQNTTNLLSQDENYTAYHQEPVTLTQASALLESKDQTKAKLSVRSDGIQ